MAETIVDSVVIGTEGDDLNLEGTEGNDRIEGLNGNDVLNHGSGRGGDDTLVGGDGDDTYYVDSAGDSVEEHAGGGFDAIISLGSYTMPLHVERLGVLLDGAVATGNELDNQLSGFEGSQTLIGLAGNDTLDGYLGDDTLIGGTGDDLYGVNQSGQVLAEMADEGFDTVFSNAAHFTLPDNVERLILAERAEGGAGNDLANDLQGNRSGNLLIGMGGDDYLAGYAGDDSLRGGDGMDFMVGGEGVDYLNGGVGDDWLDGGEGSDDQAEYAGWISDFLFTRSSHGIVVSDQTGAEGTDHLVDIEAIWFEGSQTWAWLRDLIDVYGTESDDAWLAGTARDDRLFGFAGDDQFAGHGGDDTIDGGDGQDQAVYFGRSTDFGIQRNFDGSVQVTDATGTEGSDTLVDVEALWFDADQVWLSVEDVVGSYGTAGDDGWIAGTVRDDQLYGLHGNDQLFGGAGDDRLDGGRGDWDQAAYEGDIAHFTFTRGGNGAVAVIDTTGVEGTDILEGVEAVWFNASQTWAMLADLV